MSYSDLDDSNFRLENNLAKASKGMFNFTKIRLYSNPGKIAITKIRLEIDFVDYKSDNDIFLTIQFNITPCVSGEILIVDSCYRCPKN